MKLTGIIDYTFRGQVLFRGFATLNNLARLSKCADYQRSVDDDRLKEITDYLQSTKYLFFPELLFGWFINDNSVLLNLKKLSTGSFQTGDGIKFKKAKYTLPESGYFAGDNPTTKTFSIEIPEQKVKERLFNRIDGNHRLSALDGLIEKDPSSDIKDIVVPYSVLLQFPDGSTTAPDTANKFETAYFYLINSKAKSLSTDENLQALLDDELFTENEKTELLSISNDQIRFIVDIVHFLKESKIKFVAEVFGDERYAFAYQFAKIGLLNDIEYSQEESKKIIKSLELVNCSYVMGEFKFPKNKDIILATAIIGYQQPSHYKKFIDWINQNELGTIDKLSCESIIPVFNNTHKKRSYKVFVAMPYISFKRVNEYNTLFREALSEISKSINFGLELTPIMRFRGEAQRIDKRLIECIKQCDIFVADLTTVNDNVIFEVGLAEGNNKKILLIKAEEDTTQLPFDQATQLNKNKNIPFDFDKLQYIPYSNSGYYNDIKRILKNNLPTIVEQLKKENYV